MYNQAKSIPNYPNLHGTEPDEEDDDDDEEKRILFCANLDQRVTEDLLYEVFLQAGPVESVRIPRDNGGRQKSFAFITYVHRCSIPYALNLLAGLTLFRKCLTIKMKNLPDAAPLPSDCEIMQRRMGRDNSALRGHSSNAGSNPFKRDNSPPKRIEWNSQRRSDELNKHSSHNNSRPHQNTSPYSRSDNSRNHSNNSNNSGHHNRHYDNNRRSEQRNRHR